MYQCKRCGNPVHVSGETIVRSCSCGLDVPIIGQMEATAYACGSLFEPVQVDANSYPLATE